jgi:hypothetical protein
MNKVTLASELQNIIDIAEARLRDERVKDENVRFDLGQILVHVRRAFQIGAEVRQQIGE